MARGKNTFSLAAGFNITGQQPIDSRLVVDNVADLYLADTWSGVGLYNGLVVAIKSTGTLFVLKDRDNFSNTASWVAVGGDVSADLTTLTGRVSAVETKIAPATTSGLELSNGALAVKIDSAVDNALKVTESGLKVVAPVYDLQPVETSDAQYASQYVFSKDGSTVTTINIPKDQFLKEATFVASATDADKNFDATIIIGDPYLKFVWQVDTDPDVTGIQPTTYVAVKSLVDTYTAGRFIAIDNDEISVDLNTLEGVIKNDFNLSTLETDIENLKTVVGGDDSGLVLKSELNKNTIAVLGGRLDTAEQNIANNTQVISDLNAATKVRDIDQSEVNGISLKFTEEENSSTIKVNVNLEALRADLLVNADAVLTTEDIKDAESDVDARYAQGTSVQSILANLNTRINEIDSDIQGALAGGVTNIGAGNGISVDSNTATKPVVSVKVVTGSALKATTDGLDIYWTEI